MLTASDNEQVFKWVRISNSLERLCHLKKSSMKNALTWVVIGLVDKYRFLILYVSAEFVGFILNCVYI